MDFNKTITSEDDFNSFNLFSFNWESIDNKLAEDNWIDEKNSISFFKKSIETTSGGIAAYLNSNKSYKPVFSDYKLGAAPEINLSIVDDFLSKDEDIIKIFKNKFYALVLTDLGIYEIEYDKLLKDTDINFYPKKSIKKISIKLNKENNTSEITLDNIIKKSKINFGLNTSKEIFKLIKDYYL